MYIEKNKHILKFSFIGIKAGDLHVAAKEPMSAILSLDNVSFSAF